MVMFVCVPEVGSCFKHYRHFIWF